MTDELFDLTTMAMEYFKEHIEPNLPEITYFGTDFFDITTAFSREYNHIFNYNAYAEEPSFAECLAQKIFISFLEIDFITERLVHYMLY